MNSQKKITGQQLRDMAKERGLTNYYRCNKCELAKRFGVELSGVSTISRKVRSVEIVNLDGTTTKYPSISQAVKALGKYPPQLYALALSNEVRFL